MANGSFRVKYQIKCGICKNEFSMLALAKDNIASDIDSHLTWAAKGKWTFTEDSGWICRKCNTKREEDAKAEFA